jgi:predicted phage tail protein
VVAWFVWLLIAIAFQVVAFLLAPKPKKQQPPETKDLDNPVAERGKPVPVVFGTLTVKGLNILWYGDKQFVKYKVNA